MAVVVNNDNVILYKCPYCVRGRFTATDGWNGAVRHIKEAHSRRGQNGGRRERMPKPPPLEDMDLLEEAAFS